MIKLPPDQGLVQLGGLGLAFVLSALFGLERELRNKSAGLRTNTLVGVGAALFMLVSKYGFQDVIEPWRVTLDPSRVAAQVASGIGFIGGGLIFIRRDAVCGLTTAAVVWVSAAVGLACGAGLPVLAIAVTVGHFTVVYGFTAVGRRLPTSRMVSARLRITYVDGHGTLHNVLRVCAERGFSVFEARIANRAPGEVGPAGVDGGALAGAVATDEARTVTVTLRIRGRASVVELTAAVHEIAGIVEVSTGDPDDSATPPARPRVPTCD
jgi:putative Mg2+ transporter-C (MgtC) family protein